MKLNSDYYDTDFSFTYKGNTILIRNDGPEGESLFVNGVLQDQNFSAHNGHLIGHIFDEENRKEVIEVFLGGTETRHCMVFADGALIHSDIPSIVPDVMHEKDSEDKNKRKKRSPYLFTLLIVIILAIAAGLLLHYSKPYTPVNAPGPASGEDGGAIPAAGGTKPDGGVTDNSEENGWENEEAVSGASGSEPYIEVDYTWDYGRDHWSYQFRNRSINIIKP